MVKKIAFCLRDMQLGGVENVFVRTLEQLLQDKQFDISVITYAKIRTPLYVKWFKEHPRVRVYNLYPCKWLGTDLTRVFLLRGIQHIVRDVYRWVRCRTMNVHRFDDIDVFVDYYNFSFAREFKRFHQPKITWWHSSWNVFKNGNYVRYMSDYDMLVGLTGGFADDFCALYPQYRDKVTHIFNPVDIRHIQALAQDADKPNIGKYFVSVARLARDKDIETLMRGFDLFWRNNNRPDVSMVIIGGGSLAGEYKDMANTLAAHDKIIFTGALSNPFGFVENAMAAVLSSYSEGLPTVLIEAAALKTLNISSDCKNGPRDILLNGQGGLLFVPGDVNGLAKCFSDVWNKNVDVKNMQQVAYDGLVRFNIKNVIPQISELINNQVA